MTSIQAVGAQILLAPSPIFKMIQTRLIACAWRHGKLQIGPKENVPDFPARPSKPILVHSKDLRRLKGFSPEVEILHSLAHIELGAMDNYWDTIVRFDPATIPRSFYDDLVSVVDDEAKHFGWLLSALHNKGADYGDLPAHRALLEHSANTKDDLLARLAVIPLVQEARGIDSGPRLISKLLNAGSKQSAALVKNIVDDESNHVRIGTKWFQHFCEASGLDHVKHFHRLVLHYFPAGLPGPFDESARVAAGMPAEYFLGISRDHIAASKTIEKK